MSKITVELPDGSTLKGDTSYVYTMDDFYPDGEHSIDIIAGINYYKLMAPPAEAVKILSGVDYNPPRERILVDAKEYDLLKAELVDVHEEKERLRETVADLTSRIYELEDWNARQRTWLEGYSRIAREYS